MASRSSEKRQEIGKTTNDSFWKGHESLLWASHLATGPHRLQAIQIQGPKRNWGRARHRGGGSAPHPFLLQEALPTWKRVICPSPPKGKVEHDPYPKV